MNRQKIALVMLMVSIGMGIIGSMFFYQTREGINFPLYIALMTLFIAFTANRVQKPINRRNLWIVIPILFFAGMVALRASDVLVSLNIITSLCLGTLYIRYLTSSDALDTASLADYIGTPLDVGLYMIYAPLVEMIEGLSWFKNRNWKDLGNLGSVLRGLLFTIPILLVFGVLLGSADLVFAEQIGKLFSWLSFKNSYELLNYAVVTGIFTWFMLTALSYAISRRVDHRRSTQATDTAQVENAEDLSSKKNSPLRKTRPGFRIGIIEATMILASVTALFAFFVLIQFTYLFGGQSDIAEGLTTYSTYARRGFFELVAVAVIVLGMILYLDTITIRRVARDGILFRFLSIGIVALTLVMLVSAWRRMELYELAYGFTYLRVLTHVFMFWLAVLLGVAILHLFRLRENIFAFGLLLACIGYVGTLNLMNIDNYIAERNIAAYRENESELDLCYLRAMSADAYAVLQAFYESESDTAIQDSIGFWLYDTAEKSAKHIKPSLAWHLSHSVASTGFSPDTDGNPYESVRYACYIDFWRGW